jgi:hypothetical protein
MIETPIRRVRLSTETFLSLLWDAMQQSDLTNGRSFCIGGLRGKRSENMAYVSHVIAGAGVCGEPKESLDATLELLKDQVSSEETGIEVVGWYVISSSMNIESTPALQRCAEQWQSAFPGSFHLALDPSRMLATQELSEFISIYGISPNQEYDLLTFSLVQSVDVDLGLGDLIRSLKGRIIPDQETQTNIRSSVARQRVRKVSSIGAVGAMKPGKVPPVDTLRDIDLLSKDILRLKGYLAKLKQGLDSGKHPERSWFTKRVKFLKLKQLGLFDRINEVIKATTDIQMRIALYKVRDSLTIDMKILDDMINDQYMKTLTEIVRMEPNTPE